MSSNNPKNWQSRLQELEAQIKRTATSGTQPHDRDAEPQLELQPVKAFAQGFLGWVKQLPTVGKVIVVSAIALTGLSVIRGIVSLVISGLSLAIGVALLYGVYKLFFASQSKD